jgi:NADPH:quinone reductase-like Zn-dependent oxidoreductase
MKAIVCTRYGLPDVLEIREIEKPLPKGHEVLIRIHATTVTAGDVRIRGFKFPPLFWLPARIVLGLGSPRNNVLGHEFAGEIELVGREVTRFRKGDQVFGSTGFGSGTHAEYICLPDDGTIAAKPENMGYEEAAALPVGGLTALHFLRKGGIKSGHKVLIYAASGSVGSSAVQIASSLGAVVTGVCSTRNLDLVKSLGADRVLDYTKGDLAEKGVLYDVIFDAAGKTSPAQYRGALAPLGAFVTVAKGAFRERSEDLVFLRDLVTAGKLRPVIDRRYPFEQIAEAHRYVDGGHKTGNVVVTLLGRKQE